MCSHVLELVKFLFLYVPLKRHCGYLFQYEKKVNELKSEVESLRTQRDDTNRKLDEEKRRSQRIPLDAVEVWKTRVEKVVGDIERPTEELRTEEPKCLMGWCPNLSWRYRVGKSAAKQMDQVKKLKDDRDKLGDSLTFDPPPPGVVQMRGDDIVGNEVGRTVMEQVMKALEDDNITSIGIYGMGGIGKTTLVRDINNRMLKESTLFNKVIMVTVSKDPDLKVIQDDIAEHLGMKLEKNAKNLRADKLLNGLKEHQRILIIFDDVWTELKVFELGIPRKNEHKCCKIILTTRNKAVCHQMDTDVAFEMKPWLEKDSWDLFVSKIGDVISKNPDFLPIGEDIVRECKGSPLAIVTLGSTLAKKEKQVVWQDVLRRLRSSDPTELDGIMSSVISAIKFSYDYLDDEGMKLCFLFCSLFPEDSIINLRDLRIFGIGEGFLHVEGDLLQAKVKLGFYIESLKDCGLLLDGEFEGTVKMHDVVRDTARSIALKEGHGFIEKTRMGLKDWSELKNEENCKRLSLMENGDIVTLPDSPKFPQLYSLYLTRCYGIKHIPDNFFLGMPMLVNLDLWAGKSQKIPPSISSLTSLKTLRLSFLLHDARIVNLSSLGMLKNLEILIIDNDVTVPIELAKLSNLKVLSLKGVYLLSIPKNVLSKLHLLEELYLSTFHMPDDCTDSLIEVASLKCLTVLEVGVREEELLCQNYPNRWSQLQEFEILFGKRSRTFYTKKGNTLGLTKLPDLVPKWISCLIKKVVRLKLEWRPELKKVIRLDNASTLKELEISNCLDLQHIANTEEAPLSEYALRRLEVLRIVGLSNLEKICQGPLLERSVMDLKVLEIKDCGKCLNALPYDHLKALQSLEILHLENCDAMTHVASTTDTPSIIERNALENLIELRLIGMPNLKRICDGPVPNGFLKKLKLLILRRCGKLTDVLSHVLVHCIKTIEDVELEGIYGVDKIFDFSSHLIFPNPLERLKYLLLEEIENLTVVFGGLRPTHLCPNLRMLNIKNCPELVSIWSFGNNAPPERRHEETTHNSSTPTSAPKAAIFPNLHRIVIYECHKLKKLFSLNMVQHGLQNLVQIDLQDCSQLKVIIAKEDAEKAVTVPFKDLCPQLRFLALNNLPEIMGLCSWERFLVPCTLTRMNLNNCPKLGKHHSLESLQHRQMPLVLFGNTSNRSLYFPMVLVRECDMKSLRVDNFSEIRHVLWLEKRFAEASGNVSSFSQLEELHLRDLPKLESICVGSPPLGCLFQNLRHLDVQDCNNLRYLLPLGLAQQLRNLEKLIVRLCSRLEKLISDEEETAGWTTKEGVLPQLKYLLLQCLPELTSLYSGESFLQLPSLVHIKVGYCSKLKQLSLEPNTSPNLKEIHGEGEWLRVLEQEMHTEMKIHFKPLFRVTPSDMEEEEESKENWEERERKKEEEDVKEDENEIRIEDNPSVTEMGGE